MQRLTRACAPVWVAGLLITAATPAIGADTAYTLDPGHTQVQFSWNHLGFSNPGASFDDISGTLRWDAADVTKSSVKVSIAVASVHSHVPLLDQKLKSDEFFAAGTFPNITFASTRVERAGGTDRFKVTGDLTVHGVTRPVVLDVVINHSGMYPMVEVPAVGFDATTRFRRSAFGVAAGVPLVSDEIRVQITAEALEAVGFAKAMQAMSGNSSGK